MSSQENVDQLAQEAVTEEQLQKTVQDAADGIEPESKPVDPLDQAAHMFMTSVPKIKALSSNMKRNALARVFKAVVEFPLAESYPTFKDKAESELFVLTLSAMSAKNVMTSAFAPQMQKEVIEETTNGIVQELLQENVTTKEETVNG